MHLSQNEFARKYGLASGYVSQLLSGARFPGPSARKRICAAFPDAEFEDLFEEVPE